MLERYKQQCGEHKHCKKIRKLIRNFENKTKNQLGNSNSKSNQKQLKQKNMD